MYRWVAGLISSAGYFGLAFLMFIENVFPPIPSELIMPLAGYIAVQGKLSLIGIIVAGTIGTVSGALLLYYIGQKLGKERLREFADAHGRWLTLSRRDIEKAEQWFDRYGSAAVFFCRLVPGVRSLISTPAGIGGMNLGAFVAYTTAGSAIWTALLGYSGYILGSRFKEVEEYLDPASWVIVGGLVVIYLVRVIRHRGTRHGEGAT